MRDQILYDVTGLLPLTLRQPLKPYQEPRFRRVQIHPKPETGFRCPAEVPHEPGFAAFRPKDQAVGPPQYLISRSCNENQSHPKKPSPTRFLRDRDNSLPPPSPPQSNRRGDAAPRECSGRPRWRRPRRHGWRQKCEPWVEAFGLLRDRQRSGSLPS